MDESAAVLAAISALVALLPLVWSACDRHATAGRLAAQTERAPGFTQEFVDSSVFLMQVARSVRAGATAAQAVADAQPSSAEVVAAQAALLEGAPLLQALHGDSPDVRALAACLHHGVLSPHALEHAVGTFQEEARLRSDIRTALALARRSATILTSVPFVLLALAALVSGTVRSVIVSPVVIAVVIFGAVLNRAGYAWLAASARAVSLEHMRPDRMLAVSSAVAAHLRAGGTLVSAFERLARHDSDCAAVNSLLSAGVPLRESLAVLGPEFAPLVRSLVASHTDGLPVAPAVDAVINDASARRSASVREMVATLPARGTVPLVLLVLPSFLLLAVAPLALAVLRGLQLPTP